VARSINEDVHVDLAVALVKDQTSSGAVNGDIIADALAGRSVATTELDVVDALLGHGIASELEPCDDGVDAARGSIAGQHPELAVVLDLVGRMALGQCQIPHLGHDRSGGVLELQPHRGIAPKGLGQCVEKFVRAHVVLEANWPGEEEHPVSNFRCGVLRHHYDYSPFL